MQKSRFTIGRDRNADVPIADPSVSRLHAEATLLDGDRVFLTDCNSSNGTFVIRNGAATPVRQETLSPGDDIQFGNVGVSLHKISVMQQTPPSTSSPQPEGSIYSFFVTPGALRSSGTRTLSIPEGSHAVEIQLALPEGTRFSRYAAQLETSAGERRWLAEGSAKGDAFVLLLSRNVLPPGRYATELYGILDGDRRELVDYYYFETIPPR